MIPAKEAATLMAGLYPEERERLIAAAGNKVVDIRCRFKQHLRVIGRKE